MKTPFCYRRPNEGAALIIVLALLVLVTISVLIELAISTSQRTTSDSVASGTSAELLARSAGAMIIGNLVQEIQDGSYTVAYGANTLETNGYTTYAPVGQYGTPPTIPLVPMRIEVSGVSRNLLTAYTNLPLVKESYRTNGFYTNITASDGSTHYYANNGHLAHWPVTNASAASTATLSANGHSVSPLRWNRPLFLPLNTPGSTTDFTPVSTFLAPDWIYVTRAGPKVITTVNLVPSSTSVSNPVSSNANYVVGRYAFCMYDEGGLLDVAAAGYNSASDLSGTGSLARKGCIGVADLTQIPNGSSSTGTLTQAQADALVAWRNPTSYNGTTTGGYTYYLFDQAPITGFLQPATGDQSFTSRQDLLSFWLAKISPAGTTGVDALRFFTTFSRTVNAPAWAPWLNANNLQEAPNTAYGGNVDNETPPGTNNYGYFNNANLTNTWNPNLLSVRVETPFTRLDGTTAWVGEPLIKARFDLNRLSWITYNGVPPSGVTAADIYNYFGLTWNPGTVDGTSTSSGAWVYNHLNTAYTGVVTQTQYLLSLDRVATLGSTATAYNPGYGGAREPDFFELLQAGILRGSLGLYSGNATLPAAGGQIAGNHSAPGQQGGGNNQPMWTWGELYRANATGTNAVGEPVAPPGATYWMANWQSYMDDPSSATVNVDPQGNVVNSVETYQIIQIGANIISQYSSDNYPTPIQFNNQGQNTSVLGSGATAVTSPKNSMTFYGIKNLPYFNSIGNQAFRPPQGTAITPNTAEAYIHAWIVFSLWNPHMNPGSPPASTPANLRVLCRYGQMTPYWLSTGNGIANTTIQPRDFSLNPAWVEFPANTANYFASPTEPVNTTPGVSTSDPNYSPLVPAFTAYPATDPNDAGLYVGYTESLDFTIGSNAYYNGPGTQTNWAQSGFALLPTYQTTDSAVQSWTSTFSPNEPINLELQYQGPDNNWHTYQVIPGLVMQAMQQGHPFLLPGDSQWGMNPLLNTNNFYPPATGTALYFATTCIPQGRVDEPLAYLDPRTTRIPPMNAGGPAAAPTWNQGTPVPGPQSGSTLAAQFAQPQNIGWSPSPTMGGGWYWQSWWGYHAMTGTSTLSEATWDDNFPYTPSLGSGFINTSIYYYTDRDYVRRLGDTAGYAWSRTYTGYDPLSTTNTGALAADQYRPIVLCAPFHNVGELGYTFRDDPWRSIDFFSNKSGDLALLDLFCIGPGAGGSPTAPTPPVVAGTVNINSAPSQVLTALIAGAGLTLNTSSPSSFSANLTAANVTTIVQALTNYIAGNATTGGAATVPASGPLVTPADLPFVLPQVALYTGVNTPTIPAANSFPGMPVKTSREVTIRALAGQVSTRTWNVLIDVIAQSGRFAPSATTLDQFSDKGERRYWIHVAIDRFTGKIVDEKLELVPQ